MTTFRQRYRFARNMGYNSFLAVGFAAKTWHMILLAVIAGVICGRLLPLALIHWFGL